jgi:glutaredoxin-like protein NrdH
MKKITVYTLPACRQCNMTKNWLTKEGVPFEVVDVMQDEKTADAIRIIALADGIEGKPTMPYVQYSSGDPETDFHWFGFIPDNLEKYAKPLAAVAA